MRRFLRFVPPLLLFVIGLAAGAWFSAERRASSSPTRLASHLKEAAEASSAPISETPSRFASREKMLTKVMSAVVEEEPLLRAHRLHEIFAQLTLPELRELFEHAMQMEDRGRREVVLSAVLQRWAALDPAGATAMARPYFDRARRMGRYSAWKSGEWAVTSAWVDAMPEAALAEADVLGRFMGTWELDRKVRASLADGDSARQLELLGRLPDSSMRQELCIGAIDLLARTDPAAAEAHLDLISDRGKRNGLRAEILNKLAKTDPAAALARLAELGPQLIAGYYGTQIVDAVLVDAGKQDPTSAFAVLDKLPAGLRSHATGALLIGWACKDPVAVLDWATANGMELANVQAAATFGSIPSNGRSTLLSTLWSADHAKVLDWVSSQPPSPNRDDMLRERMAFLPRAEKFTLYEMMSPESQLEQVGNLIYALNREDPKSADAWVASLSAGPVRSAAVQSLIATQINKNQDRMDTIANGWSAGPDREAALAGVVNQLASTDPQRALSFAQQMTDSANREVALERLAWKWLRRDPSEARGWIDRTTDLSADQKRVLIRQFEEE
jgi:hypothetical protein